MSDINYDYYDLAHKFRDLNYLKNWLKSEDNLKKIRYDSTRPRSDYRTEVSNSILSCVILIQPRNTLEIIWELTNAGADSVTSDPIGNAIIAPMMGFDGFNIVPADIGRIMNTAKIIEILLCVVKISEPRYALIYWIRNGYCCLKTLRVIMSGCCTSVVENYDLCKGFFKKYNAEGLGYPVKSMLKYYCLVENAVLKMFLDSGVGATSDCFSQITAIDTTKILIGVENTFMVDLLICAE